jgi:hypothetical protein
MKTQSARASLDSISLIPCFSNVRQPTAQSSTVSTVFLPRQVSDATNSIACDQLPITCLSVPDYLLIGSRLPVYRLPITCLSITSYLSPTAPISTQVQSTPRISTKTFPPEIFLFSTNPNTVI